VARRAADAAAALGLMHAQHEAKLGAALPAVGAAASAAGTDADAAGAAAGLQVVYGGPRDPSTAKEGIAFVAAAADLLGCIDQCAVAARSLEAACERLMVRVCCGWWGLVGGSFV